MKRAKIIVALPGCGGETLAQAIRCPEDQLVTTLDDPPDCLIYAGPAHTRHLRAAIEAALPNHYIEYHCIQPPRYAIDYEHVEDIDAFNRAIHEFTPVQGIQYSFQSTREIKDG